MITILILTGETCLSVFLPSGAHMPVPFLSSRNGTHIPIHPHPPLPRLLPALPRTHHARRHRPPLGDPAAECGHGGVPADEHVWEDGVPGPRAQLELVDR
jgi:hypothetical protein